ncbi:MAG: GtrA family protein [Streptococcaceae bacterium]|jgi:putative flippase GtrA|nr:GtrA family protein [Streptococcaceae bacterium]
MGFSHKFQLMQNILIAYMFFGIIATFLYFGVRFFLLNLGASTIISLLVAQTLAILFGFVTSKRYIFKNATRHKSTWMQFVQFVAGRISSVGIDFFISLICMELWAGFFISLFHLNSIDFTQGIFIRRPFSGFVGTPTLLNTFIWTVVIQILVVIFNYVISRYVVFKK